MTDKTSDSPQWLTVPAAARLLGKSDRQVYRLAKKGQIQSKKERGRIYVLVSDSDVEDGKESDSDVKMSDVAAELARLRQQVEDLTAERDRLVSDNDFLRNALINEQANVNVLAGRVQLLEDPDPDRRPWYRRFWGRGGSSGND